MSQKESEIESAQLNSRLPATRIVDVTFSPITLNPGDLLNVSITVRNDSADMLQTQGPDPSFVYDEGDTFRSRGFSETQDAYRVGIDFDERIGINHPYRWGLGARLAPGETRTFTVTIRLKTAQTRRYWAGLVCEQVALLQDRQGEQTIAVNLPGHISTDNRQESSIPVQAPSTSGGDLFSRLSPSSLQAIMIAENLRRQILRNPDGKELFTEMLLIGLYELPNNATRAVLSAYGVDRNCLITGIKSNRKWDLPTDISLESRNISDKDLTNLPYSTNTRYALETAAKIATEKGADAIRSRHILAALLSSDNLVAYQWMSEMGIPIRTVEGILRSAPESEKITAEMFGYAPGVASADLAAEKDTLGFDISAQALAEIIIKKETVPPVVFGIYGPWGSGKSTFMSFVMQYLEKWDREYLSASRRKEREPRIVCLRFDAWSYADSAKLWAGLVSAIALKLDEQIQWWQKPIYWIGRSGWRFLGTTLLSLLPVTIGVATALAVPLLTQAQNLEIVRLIVSVAGVAFSAKLFGDQKPLSEMVKSELAKLDKSQIDGVINRIQKHLHSAIEKYFKLTNEQPEVMTLSHGDIKRQSKLKVVVLIDELDRCPLEKIVDILESIKLFLAEDIFIVLMAVDTRVAAEAIRLHYRDVENPELAHEYLEKIIQVPIPVPAANRRHLSDYVGSLMSVERKKQDKEEETPRFAVPSSNAPAAATRGPLPVSQQPFKPLSLEDTGDEEEAIIDFAEKYLARNPRRIKRLLNTYRYVKILATRRGIRTDQGDWQKKMITWLGTTMRWPLFMEKAIEQLGKLTPDGQAFWDRVSAQVPEEYRPPNDLCANLRFSKTDLESFCDLADNFMKENPPLPKANH